LVRLSRIGRTDGARDSDEAAEQEEANSQYAFHFYFLLDSVNNGSNAAFTGCEMSNANSVDTDAF
jgi:hypothetical protein